jgi:hypothetical protein
MRILGACLVACSCAHPYLNQTQVKPAVIDQAYNLAVDLFVRHVPCSLPQVQVRVREVPLVALNWNNNVFCSDGLCVHQGLYEPVKHTIKVAAEKPDKRFVLFHEFLHYLIMESPNCQTYQDVGLQHKLIYDMENDYFATTGTTRKQEDDYRWIMDYVKTLR